MPGTNGSTALLKAIKEAYEQKHLERIKLQAPITRSMRQRRKGASLSLRENDPDKSGPSPSTTLWKKSAASQRLQSSTSKAKRKHQPDAELAGHPSAAADLNMGLQLAQTIAMANEEPASGSVGPAVLPPHPNTTCTQPTESTIAASVSVQPLEAAPLSMSKINGVTASDNRAAETFKIPEDPVTRKFDATAAITGAASTRSASLQAPVQGASTTGMSSVQPELPSAAARQAVVQHAGASSSPSPTGMHGPQQGMPNAAARPSPPQQAAPGPAGTACDDYRGQ
jgi:hypothetical protein